MIPPSNFTMTSVQVLFGQIEDRSIDPQWNMESADDWDWDWRR